MCTACGKVLVHLSEYEGALNPTWLDRLEARVKAMEAELVARGYKGPLETAVEMIFEIDGSGMTATSVYRDGRRVVKYRAVRQADGSLKDNDV